MFRFRTRLFAILAVFALIVAACGGDDDDATGEEETTTTAAAPETTTTAPPETTTTAAPETTTTAAPAIELLVWADEKRAPALEAIKGQVLEETGVAMTIELIDFDDLRQQIVTAAPVGEGPDIFIGAHDWTGELFANGITTPIDLAGREGEWFQAALDVFNYQGDQVAMPYATEAVGLYYNTDLSPEAPTTLEELTATCDALADQIENCLSIPGGGDGTDAYHQYPFVSALGGYIFAYDPTTGYDVSDVGLATEGAIAGVAVLEQLVADGYVASTNYDDAKNLFLEGRAPFWITGPWELGTLGDTTGLNWDLALLPQIEGNDPAPFVGGQGWFINAFSDNLGVAEAFLLQYVATEGFMTALYNEDPRNPAFRATFDAVTADNPVAETFALSAGNGVPMPNIPEMGNVWGPLGDQLLGLRNGQTDAGTAMTTANQQVIDAIGG